MSPTYLEATIKDKRYSMDWIEEFLSAFGQSGESANPFVRDQRSLVQDYVNTNGKNTQTQSDEADQQSYHLDGKDPQTGEDFALDIKTDKLKPRNKREEEWVKREMTVTFTSLDNKDKFISSSIDNLCGGRYAHLIDQELPVVAAALVTDFNDILNYADSSVASYADRITPQQAYRIARSVSENLKLSFFDYEKISSKLSGEHKNKFDEMLGTSSIKIAYPLNVLEKEIAEREATAEAMRVSEIKNARDNAINYHVSFIRDFQEYKLKNIPTLQKRVAAVLSVVDEGIRNDVIEELKKDSVFHSEV